MSGRASAGLRAEARAFAQRAVVARRRSFVAMLGATFDDYGPGMHMPTARLRPRFPSINKRLMHGHKKAYDAKKIAHRIDSDCRPGLPAKKGIVMKRRAFLLTTAGTAAAAAVGLPRLVSAAPAPTGKLPVLHYVAEADLSGLDPVWSTAYITQMYAELVYDTLFAYDEHYNVQLQMLSDAKTSADGKTWTLTLRQAWRSMMASPVRSIDCAASIRRWGSRDTLGQELMKATDDIATPDAQTLVFKLKKPFPLLPSALGKWRRSMACIMPERLAKIDSHTQITEAIGSVRTSSRRTSGCRDRPLSSSASMAINRVRAPAVLRRAAKWRS